MIETQPTVDNGCSACGGVGVQYIPIGTEGRPANGTVPCPVCRPKPIDQVADAENVRVFSDAQKRPGSRRAQPKAEWWGDR